MVEERLYKDQKLEFKSCEMEPDGIHWENLSISSKEKCLRCTLIIIFLVLFILFSIAIFLIMAGSEASLFED